MGEQCLERGVLLRDLVRDLTVAWSFDSSLKIVGWPVHSMFGGRSTCDLTGNCPSFATSMVGSFAKIATVKTASSSEMADIDPTPS